MEVDGKNRKEVHFYWNAWSSGLNNDLKKNNVNTYFKAQNPWDIYMKPYSTNHYQNQQKQYFAFFICPRFGKHLSRICDTGMLTGFKHRWFSYNKVWETKELLNPFLKVKMKVTPNTCIQKQISRKMQ